MSPNNWRTFVLAVVAMSCALGAATPTQSQHASQPNAAKWRPKAGTYAIPDKDFDSVCGEFGDLNVQLGNKSISGHEWSCKVDKLIDTAPGSIRIEMTCSDYNLAEDLKKPEDTEFKEVLLLKKIDDQSILARKTVNGKFKDPQWKAVYCPKAAQQMFLDAVAREKADQERDAQIAKSVWHPRDGVYAIPGADFDDQCTRSGDFVIDRDVILIATDPPRCKIARVEGGTEASIRLDVQCDPTSGPEKIIITNTGHETVTLQKSRNGVFSGPGQSLAYCPEATQRDYAARKTAK